MDCSSNPPRRERETAATATDAELISLARQIEALEIASDALFDGIKDNDRRAVILDEIDAIGGELRQATSELTPTTIGGFVALGCAIQRHRYGRDGYEICSQFDEELVSVLIRGLALLGRDFGLSKDHPPRIGDGFMQILKAAVAA